MGTGFVVAGLGCLALVSDAWPTIPAFAVVAIAIGLPAGPIMTLPAAAVAPQNRATGMGVYFTWYYVLMAAFPAVAGFARDMTHDSATPILIAAVMMVSALAGLAAYQRGMRMRAE
jgi:hypothetical protein